MLDPYIADVRRFGGSKPYYTTDGRRTNLSHKTDFAQGEVVTDGAGNIKQMPILPKKPCFARPERWFRAFVGSAPWTNENGERVPGDTPCDTCEKSCPGVYAACFTVAEERVNSDQRIADSLNEWIDACGTELGAKCFVLPRSKLWGAFLNAITDSGGWTNVNDYQVKIHDFLKADQKRIEVNLYRKRKRMRDKAARRGQQPPITAHFEQALEQERDRRAKHIKFLRSLPMCAKPNMRWLSTLPDETCDRIADVWACRTMLLREGSDTTHTLIAERLSLNGKTYGSTTTKALAARVGEDIRKRLDRLEDSRGGNALLPEWDYTAP